MQNKGRQNMSREKFNTRLMERIIAYVLQSAYKILVHRGFRLNFQILGFGKDTHPQQQLNIGYLAITVLSV
jgi:hypothetical protein